MLKPTLHPEIETFIKAAWPALVEYFGNSVEIVLELMYIPDEAAHEELVGWIQSTDAVDEGLKKFGRFEDEWLLDHLDEMEDHFSFNLETR